MKQSWMEIPLLRRCTLGGLALCFACSSWGDAAVQSEALSTDRPDQTESTAIVPRGRLQLESGWRYAEAERGERSLTPFATLFRVGLMPRLEARLALEGLDRNMASGETGLGDLGLGLKLRLREEAGTRPAAALLLSLSLPVGEEGISSGRVDAEGRLALSWAVSERVSLGTNLGMAKTTETRDLHGLLGAERGAKRYTRTLLLYTATVGVSITERLGGFLEVYGEAPLGSGAAESYSIDMGFTWLVRPALQFDISCGLGLSRAAEDWFISGGLSVRLPE